MEEAAVGRKARLGQSLLAFGLSALLWLLLAGSVQWEELMAAGIAGGLVVLVSGQKLRILGGIRFSPSAPLHLLRYLGAFSLALVRANLDMARRVLSPSLPLNPAVVAVQTRLQSPLGRLLLANSITLTPGTLTVDVQGDRFLIHWVDCTPGKDLAAATQAIVRTLEEPLLGFLK